MSEAKPFASLSSGLLARKGGAKPAMRPQGFNQMGVSLEDLGWNDMGHAHHQLPEVHQPGEAPEHVPSSIAALTPAPRPAEVEQVQEAPPPPVVVEQQRAIEASFAVKAVEPEASKPQPRVVPLPARQKVAPAPAKARAAFTLRLDPTRHLKLRLACAVTNRSAQMIVTEALDEYLASLPTLDALAEQVPTKLGKRN